MKPGFLEKLHSIRAPEPASGPHTAASALLALAAGVVLGVFSKWLDNLALDSTIGLHRVIEALDLGIFFSDMAIWLLIALIIAVFSRSALRAALNVFVFFAGMCAAYHFYTIVFSGFDPGSYMMIWYGITLLSPILAVLCWYAKGSGPVSVVLDVGIFAVFFLACFAMGFFYISPRGILYLITFAGAVVTLQRSPKQLAVSLVGGFLLSFLLCPFWPYMSN